MISRRIKEDLWPNPWIKLSKDETVGELGALLKTVKTSGVRTTHNRNYLIKRRLFRWILFAHTLQNSWGNRIAAEHGVVKAQGSWDLIEHSCPKHYTVLPSPTQKLMLMMVCLLGKFAGIQEHFSFCTGVQTSLKAFHSRL